MSKNSCSCRCVVVFQILYIPVLLAATNLRYENFQPSGNVERAYPADNGTDNSVLHFRGLTGLTCRGYLISSYYTDFEQLVSNQAGGVGVGSTGCLDDGNHGSPVDFHEEYTTVQSISINNCDSADGSFQNIIIQLFDGTAQTFGNSAPGGCQTLPSIYTFAAGEYLKPNSFLTMSASSSGGLYYLAFTTSLGSFAVGALIETSMPYPSARTQDSSPDFSGKLLRTLCTIWRLI